MFHVKLVWSPPSGEPGHVSLKLATPSRAATVARVGGLALGAADYCGE